MDPQILKKFEEQDQKLDAIYKSAEKTRKYILTTVIIMVASVVLPLIGLLFAIPKFLDSLSSVNSLNGF